MADSLAVKHHSLHFLQETKNSTFLKRSYCISLCFLKVVSICLVSGPLQANGFVSNSAGPVLPWCFMCAKEGTLLGDALDELRGLKCYFRDSHAEKDEA